MFSERKKSKSSDGSIFSMNEDVKVKKVNCVYSFNSLDNNQINSSKNIKTDMTNNNRYASKSLSKHESHDNFRFQQEADYTDSYINTGKTNNQSNKNTEKNSRDRDAAASNKRKDCYDNLSTDLGQNEKQKTFDKRDKHTRKLPNLDLEVDYQNIFVEDNNQFIGEFISPNNKIKIIRGYIHTNDNERLFYTKIERNKEKSKANMIMLHGLNHSGKFIELGVHFANQHFSVWQIDMRGFGYSGGLRFNSSLVDQHKDFTSIIKLMSPKLPLFQYGHSLGSTLLMSFLLSNRIGISGVVLSAPLWKMNPVHKSLNTGLRIWFLRVFGSFLQDFILNNSVNPTGLTKNSYYIKKHLDDKLIVTYLGTKLVSDLIQIQKWIDANLYKFSYPVLFIHGSDDKETQPEDTKKAFNKIVSREKDLKIMEGSLHEPFLDYEKEDYKTEITEWLRLKLISGKPLGEIKKHIHFELKAKPYNYRKKIFYLLLFILYIRGLIFVKANKTYRNNRFILFFYPLFWAYKLLITSFKITGRYFVSFLIELIREIRMEKNPNNVLIQMNYD